MPDPTPYNACFIQSGTGKRAKPWLEAGQHSCAAEVHRRAQHGQGLDQSLVVAMWFKGLAELQASEQVQRDLTDPLALLSQHFKAD